MALAPLRSQLLPSRGSCAAGAASAAHPISAHPAGAGCSSLAAASLRARQRLAASSSSSMALVGKSYCQQSCMVGEMAAQPIGAHLLLSLKEGPASLGLKSQKQLPQWWPCALAKLHACAGALRVAEKPARAVIKKRGIRSEYKCSGTIRSFLKAIQDGTLSVLVPRRWPGLLVASNAIL